MQTEYSTIKLPKESSIVLWLLREEIKSRIFFISFERAGLTSEYDGTNLYPLIFSLLDFPEPSDATMEWYLKRLDHYAENCKLNDPEKLNEFALSFYVDLQTEKGK